MTDVSIVTYIYNRANLFKYCLESISRQNYNTKNLEICVVDCGSTDDLVSLIDRYSEAFKFRFAQIDSHYADVPMLSLTPVNLVNTGIRWLATNDTVIKLGNEMVMVDDWVISEIVEGLKQDPNRMHNARAHFTQGYDWYRSYEDIITNFERNYHFAEGGPFTRSKFYFCSGMLKSKFIELGGVDELFNYGVGYDDTCLREHWKNYFGEYERETTGRVIHLFHGSDPRRPTFEKLSERIFEKIKYNQRANLIRIRNGKLDVKSEPHEWANPEMLSKIYTIHQGEITHIEDITGNSREIDLPF